MWINSSAEGFEVLDVFANGPAAAAGLRVGDKIVAVDGKPWRQVSLPALRERFRTDPPGTKVRLTVHSKEPTREAVLALKDLV
jgi:C-terminal processing protease CtpA/Prc